MNDWELLRGWSEQHSEPAFTELVRRHLNLVYGSAVRQLGQSDLAQDVCQAVFLALARKAGRIGRNVILSGWLFRTTCHIAARAVRADYRRQRRELQAAIMNPLLIHNEPVPDPWPEVAANLDAALASLAATDRDAVVLHYLERQPFRAVGERFGISEEAAKKRVGRAVTKLRNILMKRGVAVSAVALAALMGKLPAEAMPAELLGNIATAAVKGTVPIAVASLARQGLTDLFLARVRELVPRATATALLIAGSALWFASRLGKEALPPAPELERAQAISQPISLTAGSTLPAAPLQRGPSKIVLTVRAAEDNRPLQAEVLARGSAFRGRDFRQNLTTDTNGVVEVSIDGAAVDNFQLWISTPGYVPSVVRWSGHEFVEPVLYHTTSLRKGQILQGTVQNETGVALRGANITFNGPGMDLGERENIGFHEQMTGLTTDEQGRFRSDQLPLPLGDHAMSYAVEHPEYVRQTISLAGLDSLRTNHLVVLKSGLKVRGTVVDADDQPVPSAKVTESHHFAGPRRSTTADAAGAFELGPFSVGEMRLEASAEGFKEGNIRIEVNEQATNIILKLARSAGEESEWEQGMARGSVVRIRGTVIDDNSGQPISYFRVLLDEHRGGSKELLGEGHEGAFEWPVFMAFFQEFALEVSADGYGPRATENRPVQSGTQSFEIRLRPAAVLAGRVINSTGEAVADAFVGLNGDGFGCTLLQGSHPMSGNGAPQTTTDMEGRFSFKPQTGAESVLIANELGSALIPIGQLGKPPIVLQPWGAIEGTLTVAGQPAAGQEVALSSAASMEPEGTPCIDLQDHTSTDSNGRFRFAQVPAGSVVVCRYFNFNRNKKGQVGMSHHQKVIVPAGGVVQVNLGGQGQTVIGKLVLSRELKGHDWRDDLQALTESGHAEPKPRGGPDTPEWRRSLRELNRFWATQRKFYLELQPDGAFRIADVLPGEYLLQLTVKEPPHLDAFEPPGKPIIRRRVGKLSQPVTITASDTGEVQDLGTITVPLD